MATAFAPTPSRPGRTAWIAVGSVLAVAALVYGTFSVASLLAYDAYDRHVSFSTDFQVVEVDAGAGGVRITGQDEVGATVDTHVIRGFTRPTSTVVEDRGRLVIRNDCGFTPAWCSVMTRVVVQRDTRVVIRTSGGSARVVGMTSGGIDVEASGGGIHVTGATGDVRLRSSGGGIDATDMDGGLVRASSSGGGVHLEFRRPPLAVDASSSGGGVTVVVPHDSTSYRVDANSSGGGTSSDIRTDPDSQYSIKVRSSGGGVTVRYPE